MSDLFKLQRVVYKDVVRAFPPVSEGMCRAVRTVMSYPAQSGWGKWLGLEWHESVAAFEQWLRELLAAHPLPRSTRLLWFEVPGHLNPALTSISAYAAFAPAESGFGAESSRTWPIDRKGFTLAKGLHELDELERAFQLVGGREPRMLPGFFALSYAYTALMVVEVLPRILPKARLPGPDGMAVTIGWASGDVDPLGVLTAEGWRPFRKPTSAERAAVRDPYMLKPSSPSFDPDAYVKAGLDINARNDKGRTVLAQCHYAEIDTIRRLIRLGADVRARHRNGDGVLHEFGACKVPILKCLLQAGADPRCVNRRGASALDDVLHDGRCTLEHIRTLTAAGARLRSTTARFGSALHVVAAHSIYNESRAYKLREMLAYWVSCGCSMEKRDPRGCTPLWVALCQHADDLIRYMEWLKHNQMAGGTWDYQHDRVAIMLLKLGANPNARLERGAGRLIPRGATPLMCRRYTDDKLAKALLAHGADPHARCAKGLTALDYARKAAADPRRLDQEGAARIVRLLEKFLRNQPRASSHR